MEALLWQYAFGRPVTEAMANGHADAGELFEAASSLLWWTADFGAAQ
jgi:hypothetical protein